VTATAPCRKVKARPSGDHFGLGSRRFTGEPCCKTTFDGKKFLASAKYEHTKIGVSVSPLCRSSSIQFTENRWFVSLVKVQKWFGCIVDLKVGWDNERFLRVQGVVLANEQHPRFLLLKSRTAPLL
jgi:hypothetical protein